MKQKFLLFAFALAFTTLNAQVVTETQTPIITKFTATWCPNCGTWGWTFFEDVIEDNMSKAIMIGAHFSGDLNSDVSGSMTSNFSAIGQPKFYVNGTDLKASRTNGADKRTEAADLVDANIAEAPVANVGFYAEIVNGQINVRTKTKFFQDAVGEYYLGLYVTENNVQNNQSGQSGTVSHPNVMRASFIADHFGELINDAGDPIAGITGAVKDYSMDLNPNWVEDQLSVVGIIWKKNGDKYEFVNASKTNDFSGILSSVVGISQVEGFVVTPTIVTETATVEINLTESIQNAALNIFDLTGKKVATVFAGNLNSGIQTFEINRSAFATSGMYFLTLENNGKLMTQKVIVK